MYDSIPSHRITISMGANTIPFDPQAPRTTLKNTVRVRGAHGPFCSPSEGLKTRGITFHTSQWPLRHTPLKISNMYHHKPAVGPSFSDSNPLCMCSQTRLVSQEFVACKRGRVAKLSLACTTRRKPARKNIREVARTEHVGKRLKKRRCTDGKCRTRVVNKCRRHKTSINAHHKQ